jgi:hypothetical protein
MRRKRLPPKPERPPEGYVLRRGRSGELEEFPEKMISEMSDWLLKNNAAPDWSWDPTYNLRRKK